MLFSAIKLTSEQSHPEYERDENAKTRIDQRWRPYIRMKPRPNKEPPSEQSRANPDQSAEHPGRKKRADNIDLWSHRSPLITKISRAKDAKNANYEINSKHEIRNSKQIQMTKRMENSKRALLDVLVPIWTFDFCLASPFVSDFDIRISVFPASKASH
jgi:hypothetical protein